MRGFGGLLCVIGFLVVVSGPWAALAAEPSPRSSPEADAPADSTASATPATEPSESTEPPPEETDASNDAEVSILSRKTPLDKEHAYVDGDSVTWTEEGAHVRGNAFIRFENMTLQADEVWTDLREILRAEGNVRLTVDEEITYADELVFNFKTKKGIAHGGAAYGAPWYYQGYEILRVSEKESLIKGGRLTTSSLKYPHTYFKASRILVHLGKEIIAKHVVFMIGGVPLLYLPAYRRSLKEKKPAAIIVKLGSDSFQGTWTSVILPLARRQRVRSVVQFDYSSLRGTGQGFETTYRIRDAHLREIVLKIPEDATPEEKSAIRRRAQEVNGRLRGDYNHVRVERLFLPFEVLPEDVERARQRAQEVLDALDAEDTDDETFGQLAGQYSNDADTRNNRGVLGYIAEGDGVLPPELERAALSLGYGEVSPLIERPEGFYLFRVSDVLAFHGRVEKEVQLIKIAIEASDAAKKAAQKQADQLVKQARSGEPFEALIERYGGTLPASALVESEKEGPPEETPPAEIWVPLNEFDYAQRRALNLLKPGEITDPIEFPEGLLILRLEEEEPTPDFAELAREISQSESAERGGDIGFVGRTDVPRQVYNAAIGLEKNEVSNVVETPEAYYVVQSIGRRTIQGEATIATKDISSYGRENTFRIGRQWDVLIRHQQDIPTRWDKRGRRLAFWGRIDFGSRAYRQDYGRDRSELRTFGVLTFDSNPVSPTGQMPSFRSRLTFDKTLSFVEGSIGTVQKLPELTFSWGGDLKRVFGFRQLNDFLEDVADTVEEWNIPPLKMPTLDNMRFSLDGSLSNLFRDRFRYAEAVRRVREMRGLGSAAFDDVYLRTLDLGLDLSKQSRIEFLPKRELALSLDGTGQIVWHEKDQKGNRNIFRGVFSGGASVSNRLFRVYNIGWVPGASRLRHELVTSVSFDWAPSVNDLQEDPNSPDAVQLYPFGSSTYLFERKLLTFSFETNVQIKTRLNKVIRALSLRASTSRNYAQRLALSNRKWDFLRATLNFSPLANNNLNGTLTAQLDPNTYPPTSRIQRDPFSLVSFSSTVRYQGGDYQKGWGADLGTQFQRLTSRGMRSVVAGFRWRPSTLFEINIDTRFDYDRFRLENPSGWRVNPFMQALGLAYLHPFSQEITIRRNLRDWDLRISWRRYGNVGNVRKEFTYQINLIADPTITMGIGYDAVTNRWGFRSLPIGVPPTFTGGSLGRSRF